MFTKKKNHDVIGRLAASMVLYKFIVLFIIMYFVNNPDNDPLIYPLKILVQSGLNKKYLII